MSKGKKMALWSLGIVIAVIAVGALALQAAISHNGAAVLNAADRFIGGARDVELVEQAQFGETAKQEVIVYADENRSDSDEAKPVIIFVHGGSWASGDPNDYGFIARALVPEGFVVALPGYRLHPTVEFPAMLEDTASAIGWVKANIAAHGGDPERIILAGHSAGAYNVVMSALDTRWLEREGLSGDDIKAVIGLAGPYDFYPFDTDSTIASFGNANDPEATQPINAVRGDAPPMLLIHGEKDTTVRPRNSRVLSEALNAAGAHALHTTVPEWDHARVVMALASPYRSNSAILDAIAGFADTSTRGEQTSVPVKDETR